jgi:hypothetical protein
MRARVFAIVMLGAGRAAIPQDKEIASPRIHLGDLVDVGGAAAAMDVGPAPLPGGSRIFTQADIAKLIPASEKARAIPLAVRVIRKTQDLGAREVEMIVRDALAKKPLPAGATLDGIQAAPVRVAAGWTSATFVLSGLPRQVGLVTTTATIQLEQDGIAVGRIDVPLRLKLSPEAAAPVIVHGAVVSLLIQRGLVQVQAPAIASNDGWTGDVITVTIRSTARVVRARVLDAKNVVLVEGGS